MKNIVRLLLLMYLLCLPAWASPDFTGGNPVIEKTHTVQINDTSVDVKVVWSNLNDPQIRVDTVLADHSVGQTAALGEMVDSVTNEDSVGLAGINGTFFNAYSDFQPQGTIIRHGKLAHISNIGSVLHVDDQNKVVVSDTRVFIEGGTQNQWNWPYSWYAWNINHFYSGDDAVMVFDKTYDGPKPDHGFTAISVDKGIVTKITLGGFDIPQDGFLVLAKDNKVIDVLKLGQSAEFRFRFEDSSKVNLNDVYQSVRTGIGAGPTLVKDGAIVADAAKEGFTETKITEEKATRSIVGATPDGYLGMAVLSNMTVMEAAQVAVQLNMVDAINLDGGGSSALYANGSYIAGPGRAVSNALVIRKLKNPVTTIQLNGETLFFDVEPFIDTSSNRTLVPLRGIAEALGAVVGWDANTSSITMKRYGKEIKLKVNSAILEVDGLKTEMDTAVVIRANRSFVPVRFITDVFGGKVGWDGSTRTVSLDIIKVDDLLSTADQYYSENEMNGAVKAYKAVLEQDDENMHAIKRLASIYYASSDFEQAVKYLRLAVESDSSDTGSLNSLAWASYSLNRVDEAVNSFNELLKLVPESPTGYYGLALCNSHYSVKNITQAVAYFELAIDKGLSGEAVTAARAYLAKYGSN